MRPRSLFPPWARALLLAVLPAMLLAACSSRASTQASAAAGSALPAEQPAGAEQVELAALMARFEHHAAKLGFAVQDQNPRLAGFYLDELEETLEELQEIEADDGMPIAHPAGVILRPALPPLRASLAAGAWPAATAAYRAVIDACNRCHAATEHEFIQILPATGPAPFFQRFAPAPATP